MYTIYCFGLVLMKTIPSLFAIHIFIINMHMCTFPSIHRSLPQTLGSAQRPLHWLEEVLSALKFGILCRIMYICVGGVL